MKEIYIAGGCFWGVERYYQLQDGIIETKVGYANGNIINPKYQDLKKGLATHVETVKIKYDEKIISLNQILEHFLSFVDPYSIDRQGMDIGHQYRSGIYYVNSEEREAIITFLNEHLKPNYQIEVKPLENFYMAEEEHQNYLIKNPQGYCHINLNRKHH